MRRRFLLPLLATAFAPLVCPPASAANPKVALKLEQVTCQQAAEALAKATGVPIEVRGLTSQLDAPPNRLVDKRASFDWSNARLGRALRDLCREFDLTTNFFSGAYTLFPSPFAPVAAVAQPKGLVEKGGLRLYPTQLSLSSHRSINFERDGEPQQSSSLNLGLRVEWPDGDAATLAGFENIVAKDDLGNLLENPVRPSLMDQGGLGAGSRFPDEWSGSIHLVDPHPRARKIQLLEGDLLVYKFYRPVRLEVGLPDKATSGSAQVSELRAEILGIDAGSGERGPTVRGRITLPRGEHIFSSANGSMFTPVLIGASGKSYQSRGGSASGRGDADAVVYTLNTTFQPIDEPIVKAVFSLVEKGEPEKLISFRLTNIAFPPDGVFVPRRQAPAPSTPMIAPAKPERPFYQAGGGTLLLRTEIAGKAVGEGSLSVGLAPKSGGSLGPVRWQEVAVDATGSARLPEVKPGTYRLLRIYRPKAATVVEGDGKWENGETEVEIVAGKEAMAVPLRWSLETPKARPPAKRQGRK